MGRDPGSVNPNNSKFLRYSQKNTQTCFSDEHNWNANRPPAVSDGSTDLNPQWAMSKSVYSTKLFFQKKKKKKNCD